jgi:hypothetical protein
MMPDRTVIIIVITVIPVMVPNSEMSIIVRIPVTVVTVIKMPVPWIPWAPVIGIVPPVP